MINHLPTLDNIMSKSRSILETYDLGRFKKSNLLEDYNPAAYDNRLTSALIDASARYRTTDKLEYKLNLLASMILYSAALSCHNDNDKNRLIGIAASLTRELFPQLRSEKDISDKLDSISDRVKDIYNRR